MPRALSRPKQWAAAISDADDAIQRLIDLQGEYQEWRDGLPENLETSVVAEKLDAIIELDLESAQSAIGEAEGCDLPIGFGRD